MRRLAWVVVICCCLAGLVQADQTGLEATRRWLADNGKQFTRQGLLRTRGLKLKQIKVRDADIKHIVRLTNLTWLELDGRLLSNRAVRRLTGLRRLQVLKLPGARLDDETLTELARLSRLQVLEIPNARLRGSGLEALLNCTELRSLYLPASVPKPALRSLERERPNIRIKRALPGGVNPDILFPIFIGVFVLLCVGIPLLSATARGRRFGKAVLAFLHLNKAGCIPLTVGILLLLLFALLLVDNIRFLQVCRTTNGEVIGLVRRTSTNKGKTSVTWAPKIRYLTHSGVTVVFVPGHSSSPPAYQVGEPVEVLYNPDRPREAHIKGFWGIFSLFAWTLFAGIGMTVFLTIGIRKTMKAARKRREELQRYQEKQRRSQQQQAAGFHSRKTDNESISFSLPDHEQDGMAVQELESAAGEVLLRFAKDSYQPGEAITLYYSGLPGNDKDWITFVERNADAREYGQWFYTQGKQSGSYVFNGVEAGRYEARIYFDWPDGGYHIRHRCQLRVE